MHVDPEMSKIPVIIISNSGQPVEIERAKQLGARDFLVKAVFDPGEVLSKVELLLNNDSSGGAKESQMFTEKFSNFPAANSVGGEILGNEPQNTMGQHTTTKNKGKILVIEDDKFLRELLVRKLLGEGFSAESAIDATSAFDILSRWTPDIILLDLILPGEDGFSILEKLKKDKKFADIPVIILSNLGQQEDIDRAMALGAQDFMVKANFTLDEIIGKIRTALGLE